MFCRQTVTRIVSSLKSHDYLEITLHVILIDSWEFEVFYIYIDGTKYYYGPYG